MGGKFACGWNAQMSLTDSEIRAFPVTDKRQKKSCGDSLFLIVEPISKGGGKSFVGMVRYRQSVGWKVLRMNSMLLRIRK